MGNMIALLSLLGMLVSAGFGLKYYLIGLDFKAWTFGAIFVVLFVSFVDFMNTPESPEIKEAKQKQRQLDAVPRKLSSVDGCTVYTFKPQDRWLYFTKCENVETTTTNEYIVKSGKTTRVEQMEIKTK